MTPVEIIAAGLIFLFIFLGIIFSLVPRSKQKEEPPRYRQTYRKYLPRKNHYARRK